MPRKRASQKPTDVVAPWSLSKSWHRFPIAQDCWQFKIRSVRNCVPNGEAKVSSVKQSTGFSDYYETLQLSPNADSDTVDRIYRMLVKRYHPDNRDTGNAEKFNTIIEAYRVLSDPDKRAAYDVKYEENRASVLKIFDEASAGDSFTDDKRICDGVLSLLYISRRRDAEKGGMGIIQIERLLGCPAEHLGFHVWYLKEKGWIQRLENGMLSITAEGVDKVIEQDSLFFRRDRLIADQSVSDSQRSSNGHKEGVDLLNPSLRS